ncbi:hypothetical protein [Nocardia sp. NPDC003963]
MGTVVVLGEPGQVRSYALAGAVVVPAVGAAAVRQAWRELDAGTAVVVVTAAAAKFLTEELEASSLPTVVMPE